MCGFAQERFFPQLPPTSDPGAISCCSVRVAVSEQAIGAVVTPEGAACAAQVCDLQAAAILGLNPAVRGSREAGGLRLAAEACLLAGQHLAQR